MMSHSSFYLNIIKYDMYQFVSIVCIRCESSILLYMRQILPTLILFTLLISFSFVNSQYVSLYSIGQDFESACLFFYDDRGIGAESEGCEDELFGTFRWLGYSFLISIKEDAKGKVQSITLNGNPDNSYNKSELYSEEIDNEIKKIQNYLNSSFDIQEIQLPFEEINFNSSEDIESKVFSKWFDQDKSAMATMSLIKFKIQDQTKYVISTSITNETTKLRGLDNDVNLQAFANNLFSELGVIKIDCPDLPNSQCGFIESKFKFFQSSIDYELEYNENLGDWNIGMPWELEINNGDKQYQRIIRTNGVSLLLIFLEGEDESYIIVSKL